MNLHWVLLFASLLCFSLVAGDERNTYIIRVQHDLKPSVFADVQQWYASTLRTTTTTDVPTKSLMHVYKTVFHGFSAKLTDLEAEAMKARPEVLGVYPDRVRKLLTTRSPQFLGLAVSGPNSLLTESDYGSNVVIGVLDTGIWPERRSFHDKDLGPLPLHWKGECEEGKGFLRNLCSKKVIGARFFSSGYEAKTGLMNETVDTRSARDTEGHGTHTASIAAGRYVPQASLFGYAKGVAVGMAPKARIAVYKICWDKGCVDSDILAAIEKAVEDGVDVISMSIGANVIQYNLDPISIGAFGAMEHGVFVSVAAGNDGPGPVTVTNIAPWLTTVGAGTIDRSFPADLILEDGQVINGASLYGGPPLPANTSFPIVYAANVSALVEGQNGTRISSYTARTCAPKSLDPELVRGKIVLCERGGSPRASKGSVVKEAGGVGMILANVVPDGEGLVADAHVLPALQITESAGSHLLEYISANPNSRVRLSFRGTQLDVKPAPLVAGFSSRGPNIESPYIIKPDLIAPGVNILAAWPDGVSPSELVSDPRRSEFNSISGTSMSCPHVSGLAALLIGAHPNWSPAEIKSAMMTSAYAIDLQGKPMVEQSQFKVSTPWDMGSGHVNPSRAVDPGLVFDITAEDYVGFLCASNYTDREIHSITRRPSNCSVKAKTVYDLNYPSISAVFDQPEMSTIFITRTATHVSEGVSSYIVTVQNPKGAVVTIEPPSLNFSAIQQRQSFVIKVKATGNNTVVPLGESKTEFGRLTWQDGTHVVGMPIAVTFEKPLVL
ncbi:hypothetical protein GIB67_017127 [Kingdonia uniflora]|uniref:Uncharacterized protein n=1 Tax=Kingdonia uniflora TaxID=39325 RepID=A0A7J7P5Z1_9MAGN|nr:hypothetical protein GIB67_017127 [Kingdonia uniflora]